MLWLHETIRVIIQLGLWLVLWGYSSGANTEVLIYNLPLSRPLQWMFPLNEITFFLFAVLHARALIPKDANGE